MKESSQFSVSSMFLMLLVIFGVFGSTELKAQKGYEYLIPTLETAKTFTVQVFEAMPNEGYTFQPSDEVRTFGEQAYHIAYSLEWYNANLGGSQVDWAPGDEARLNKQELIKYITSQFDAFIETVKSAEESGEFTVGIMSALQHNSHHRGQMVAYLRNNGIAPPAYQ